MQLIVDTHVHYYPCYGLPSFLVQLGDRLRRLAPGATPVAVLAERQGQQFFKALAGGQVASVAVRAGGEPGAVQLTGGPELPLWVMAGRQVVTRERLEVLVLTVDLEIVDGLAAGEVIERALGAGAIPVIPWAPGKWLGARGRCLAALLEQYAGRLWLGDSTLRPRGAPTPSLFGRAVGVLAGSDPLPFAGDAGVAGTFASLMTGELDATAPVTALRRALLDKAAAGPVSRGRRSTLPGVFWRLAAYYAQRRQEGRGDAGA